MRRPHALRRLWRSSLPVVLPGIMLLGAGVNPCHAQRAEGALSAGGFAPGARASASANGTLDSVVGNRPSPVKAEVGLNGETYRVTPAGTLIGPDGQAVSGGCPAPDNVASGQFVAGGAPSEPALRGSAGAGIGARKDEAVMIGVTDQAAPLKTARNHDERAGNSGIRPQATMNASFGPAGVYVLPEPCRHHGAGKAAMIHDAAASLASAGGNVFALAGNRDGMRQANRAVALPDGDVLLTTERPDHAEPRLAPIATDDRVAASTPQEARP
ncbi:hypothetical protein ASAP_2880 [Asaia bogorensis]|uniref:Uncharacterized protein n=2 Tax=Acetobacteraceae TaxID=433 RepID=A0A060QIY0_9PROT|nr:hypothetical protein P792_12945 [Asaia sp. SF2.1]CDG40925.1 hypothetical protein ASAP_2880 [Asaia bogorensis]